MEWEFTVEDVVKARSAYALEDFRRDLAEEVRMNLGSSDPMQQARTFNLLYDMCHALATGRSLELFLQPYAYDPPTCEFLREVRPLMAANVDMLGAIICMACLVPSGATIPRMTSVAPVTFACSPNITSAFCGIDVEMKIISSWAAGAWPTPAC